MPGLRRPPSTYQRIYDAVRRIPRGRVATYGQLADLSGLAGHARLVGYAMSALEDGRVPWHRVINGLGRISPRDPTCARRQQRLLEAEGVQFDARGRVELERFRWRPRSRISLGSRTASRRSTSAAARARSRPSSSAGWERPRSRASTRRSRSSPQSASRPKSSTIVMTIGQMTYRPPVADRMITEDTP